MASIWKETKRGPAVKIVGNVNPMVALKDFSALVKTTAKEVGAAIEWRSRTEAILRKAGQEDQLLFIELLSPPSAPEANVPKRADGGGFLPKGAGLPRGILVHRGGIAYIGGAPA